MSVQQNITQFRQTLKDRIGNLTIVEEEIVADTTITPTGGPTDLNVLSEILTSFTNAPSFTGTAEFVNISVENALIANGSIGNNGQVLTTDGTKAYWGARGFSNGESLVADTIQANTITVINIQSNTITANGTVGAASQVLMSGGASGNLYWSTISSPTITLDATLAGGSTSSRTIGIGNTTITGFANITSTIQVAGVATFSNTVQTTSFGVGTSPSGTAGEIRATNNITAYYSSDKRFKENIQSVIDPLSIVTAIGSKTFQWTDAYIAEHGGEDEYFLQKADFGVIAQDVKRVFPQAVRTRSDGSLAVDYGKLAILSFGAIEQLLTRIKQLESNKSS